MTSVGTVISAQARRAAAPSRPGRRRGGWRRGRRGRLRRRIARRRRDARPAASAALAREHRVALPLVDEAPRCPSRSMRSASASSAARRAARSAAVGDARRRALEHEAVARPPGGRRPAGARRAPRASSRRRAPGRRRAPRAGGQRVGGRLDGMASGGAAACRRGRAGHGTMIAVARGEMPRRGRPTTSPAPVNPWSSRSGRPAPPLARRAQSDRGVTVIALMRAPPSSASGRGPRRPRRDAAPRCAPGRCAAPAPAPRVARSSRGSPPRGRRASRRRCSPPRAATIGPTSIPCGVPNSSS